jgi:hypothetical protein
VAAGKHIDKVERLERVDYRDDDHERRRAPDQRQGNGEESSYFPCAVDLRRLVEVLGYALHGGEQDDGGEGHALPDADQAQ